MSYLDVVYRIPAQQHTHITGVKLMLMVHRDEYDMGCHVILSDAATGIFWEGVQTGIQFESYIFAAMKYQMEQPKVNEGDVSNDVTLH